MHSHERVRRKNLPNKSFLMDLYNLVVEILKFQGDLWKKLTVISLKI